MEENRIPNKSDEVQSLHQCKGRIHGRHHPLVSCDSLTSFMFPAFPNLRLLTIKRCENLRSLEMMSELQFLWQLSIKSRLKLDNIRLPASLSELRIGECPLFGECRRRKDRHIWPTISRISTIYVDRFHDDSKS
ncbi:hypothetical protein Ahy_A02g005047 [Arachis hypogaea]|uniref:Disease resistance protein n=1 Tax=Arachis hypogaea TaxID=3818 RepID=A0A445E5I1_ARAHY|nr:hypothetical protein Ahy_A02g005047 [Arachis hypogaea]